MKAIKIKKTKYNFWASLTKGELINMVQESCPGQYLSNSQEVFNVLQPLFDKSYESMFIVYLNAKNKIIVIEEAFKGSLTSSAVYPREIIKKIIEHNAAAIILAHNHPSGDCIPSESDLKITKMIDIATNAIGVTVHDHMIISQNKNKFYSMADKGHLQLIINARIKFYS